MNRLPDELLELIMMRLSPELILERDTRIPKNLHKYLPDPSYIFQTVSVPLTSCVVENPYSQGIRRIGYITVKERSSQYSDGILIIPVNINKIIITWYGKIESYDNMDLVNIVMDINGISKKPEDFSLYHYIKHETVEIL